MLFPTSRRPFFAAGECPKGGRKKEEEEQKEKRTLREWEGTGRVGKGESLTLL